MSEYYMAYSGAELDDAVSKVKNGYINPDKLLTHITKSASGQFTGSGETLNNISIDIGFKPKIFLLQNVDAVYTGSTSSPYSLVGSIMICDDNYVILQRRTSFVLKGDNTKGLGRGGQSANGFEPSDNGVKGCVTSIKANNGITFNWWAWG